MNERRPCETALGKPATRSLRDQEVVRLRGTIALAVEALGSGDQDGAVDPLLAAIENEPYGGTAPAQTLECSECLQRFRWPGELDHHQRFLHDAAA